MMASLINRRQMKAEVKTLLADAQVSPKAMTALYLLTTLAVNMLSYAAGDSGIFATFINILTSLITFVLTSGFVLYCMAIRRGERAEFLTLFDGFSFVGKIIALNLLISIYVSLWTMLFVIPGIIAAYRYRFALYNLYENPEISVFEALHMSKQQTRGYKSQLFALDISYFGWAFLASIPVFLESSLFVQQVAADYAFPQTIAMISAVSPLASIPAWAWTLIAGIWSLVVSLFYLPNYQCVELGYFEIAKTTSGIGSASYRDPWANGPDNMGGF